MYNDPKLLHFLTFVLVGNRGCGVWVMLSSLPQLIGNYITRNRMYGLAVFCRKDPAFSAGGERGGERERGGQENFHEEGELLAWESDMDSEDERFSTRRPITVALVENNCISQNGGEKKLDLYKDKWEEEEEVKARL